MISDGPALHHLATFVNGYAFKPHDLAGERHRVIRIRQLLDPEAPEDRTDLDVPAAEINNGDLIMSWSASLAVRRWTRGRALLNQHLFRVDTNPDVDSRWFEYVLNIACRHLEGLMHGSAMTHITRDMLREVRVNLPDLDTQRAIADFLDTETARLDKLVAKNGRLLDALRERLSGFVERQIRGVADGCGEIPLKFVVPDVTVGIVITPAKWYSDEGVPAIRGTNVLPGRIDMSDMVYLTPEGHSLHKKSALCEGDLVVVRTGQAGSAAVVPKELDGANCIDVLLIRQSTALLPRYLEYVINSDWTRKHIEAHSVGTIQSHFNVGALRELRIPVPGLTLQEDVVRRLDRESDRVQRLTSALARQIDLLIERRQALITAAVTGELDVAHTAAEEAS